MAPGRLRHCTSQTCGAPDCATCYPDGDPYEPDADDWYEHDTWRVGDDVRPIRGGDAA